MTPDPTPVGAKPRPPLPMTPPLPPVTIVPTGDGQVLVRGLGRRGLDAAGAVGRTWDPIKVGWLLPETAAEAVAAWCRTHGRSVERAVVVS